MPEASVLIPTYNGAEYLIHCLARISAAADGLITEIIVADNGSKDGSPAQAARVPGVHVLELGRNTGFSVAVNEAARHAKGEVFILLNQDVYLEAGALRVMHRFLRDRRALAGGRLLNPDGSDQPSCGPFPTLANTLWRLALPKQKRKYYVRKAKAVHLDCAFDVGKVDWVTGAFLGCPRRVFEELSGLDEDYFMYYEDVDLCLRAARAGVPTCFLPAAAGVHQSPYAGRSAPDCLNRQVRRSQMTFFRKHRPTSERAAVTLLNRAHFAWKGWEWTEGGA